MPTLIVNHEGLIGDFLGTIPAMQEIAKRDKQVYVIHNDSVTGLFQLIRPEYNLKRHVGSPIISSDKVIHLTCTEGFKHADSRGLYMSDAYLSLYGFKVDKSKPAKADLYIERKESVPGVDFVLAPFSRCLPDEQKWDREKWQALVDAFPDNTFAVCGTTRHDMYNFVTGTNVINFYDNPFNDVADLLMKSRYGLISVVTGIPHLAFHLSVPNFLITNQGDGWGNNPDAHKIRNDIKTLTTEEVITFINTHKR
jgi:hypothetical protein